MDRQELRYDHISKIFSPVRNNQNPTGCSRLYDSVIYSDFFRQVVCETFSLSKSSLRAALLRVSEKV